MTYIEDRDLDLETKKIFLIFQRRWKIGLFTLFLSVVLSALAASQKKPQYTAVGKLLFKNSATSELTGIEQGSNKFETLEKDANPTATEIEVLKSVPIAKQTIAELELTDESGEPMNPSILLDNIAASPVIGTDVVTVSYQSPNPEIASKIVDRVMSNYIQNSRFISGENVINANKIIEEQLPKAKAKLEEREKALRQFQEKNQIFFVDEESRDAVENLQSLEQQIEETESELKEVQARSIELQQQLGMNAQQSIAWNQLSKSPDIIRKIEDLQEVQSQLVGERERFDDSHPTIISLQNQAAGLTKSLQQRIQGISSELSVEDLQILDKDNISQELTSILAEAEVQKQGLTEKLSNLRGIKRAYQQNISKIPKLAHENRDLQLKLQTAESKYKFLLKQSQELNLAQQQNFDNVRVIESAQIQEEGVSSSYAIFLSMGTLLGTILAVSVMTGIDLVDDKIKSPEEIKGLFGYKILGIIPDDTKVIKSILDRSTISAYLNSKVSSTFQSKVKLIDAQSSAQNNLIQKTEMLPVRELPDSLSSRAFWMLQAKIKLLKNERDRSEQIIVVSSSLPKEGKSMVTANLALSLCQLGEKVLIIDANLHQPVQHQFWQVDNSIGLSDAVLDPEKVDSAIVSITDSLDLLPSGQVYSNPLKVIDSAKMELLLWDLAEKYQLILIDSPSLQDVPDALSLAKIADGMLLVAKTGELDYQSATICKELLEMTGINVIGLVVNDSD